MQQREQREQEALIRWKELNVHRLPGLHLLFAIPNGGARHIKTGRDLKAAGVRAGVPDLFLPVPRERWHGLFIEMKAPGGRISSAQQWWLTELAKVGYQTSVCWSWQEAADLLERWLII